MRIGIIIGRIGGVDGVALETEKWIEVMQRMGHEIFILSGQYEERPMDNHYETLVPEMSFFSPESYWSQKKAFFYPETNPSELIDHIDLYSKVIYKKILEWIREKKIELIISENASCLPSHLEMGLAIKNAVKKSGIPCITHDHDFAWERGDRYISPHAKINEYVDSHFPMRLHNVHAVINTHAQNTLKDRFGRDSVNVPNVMNFDIPYAVPTDHNKNINRVLGYKDQDILLFQITRVVRRKGIETAIDLVHQLEDEKIKLVITGNYADDEGSKYYNELVNQIHDLKLGERVRFAYHCFHNKGPRELSDGGTGYSLSDAYARARACTYFSTYEGFGNAFVEAVLARRPIFVNNYQPVYWPDIGSKGFRAVMLENNKITPEALEEIRKVIYDDKVNREVAEHNFNLGKKIFSYDTLEEKLDELVDGAIHAA
jgi:glycosyltransferase involved in cell wall biosynthesis